MRDRYRPLSDYLAARPPEVERLMLTLPEIAAIVGGRLPRGAETRLWWSNARADTQARAWLDAGWYVAERGMRQGPPTVTFARGAPSVGMFGRPVDSTG